MAAARSVRRARRRHRLKFEERSRLASPQDSRRRPFLTPTSDALDLVYARPGLVAAAQRTSTPGQHESCVGGVFATGNH
jgi:hypothetical protein